MSQVWKVSLVLALIIYATIFDEYYQQDEISWAPVTVDPVLRQAVRVTAVNEDRRPRCRLGKLTEHGGLSVVHFILKLDASEDRRPHPPAA